jgi:hypothetical protein
MNNDYAAMVRMLMMGPQMAGGPKPIPDPRMGPMFGGTKPGEPTIDEIVRKLIETMDKPAPGWKPTPRVKK